jgi:hypothetical protein
MQSKFVRILSFVAAIVLGCVFFLAISYLGKKSDGPISTLLLGLEKNVHNIEQKVIGVKKLRSENLKWFEEIRNDPNKLKQPNKLLLGAYDDNTMETYEPVIALEDSLHTKLPIIHFYTAWGSKREQVFPFLRAQAIYDLGSIPMITWEPWLNDFEPVQFPFVKDKENPNLGGMAAIASGEFDAYIDQWAATAAKFGHPFFLRWAHEMNDPYRYPWGPQNNKPAEFVAAWKHIKKRFEEAGATNAIFVWSPHPAYEDFASFFPGTDVVDWVGVTTINYGTVASWSRWWTFQEIYNNANTELVKLGKPIMLTEFSSLSVGGNRAEWFREALDSLPTRYPEIKSVVFFHVHNDVTTSYKALDWSFRTDSAVVKELRTWIERSDL